MNAQHDAERERLRLQAESNHDWKFWGTYVSERQWGTMRENYSTLDNCWNYFPHDHARSRAYRWGEDGLFGLTDRQCRLCFSMALWNGQDPILKERLFGLTGPEGNHGEDVKELYYYLDATPTHSYCKALYKYPQAAFPYQQLLDENHRRGREQREFELLDSGVFNDDLYFDVFVEYAKAAADDILIRIRIVNRAAERAQLHLLPTLWFRNTWVWGDIEEESTQRPNIRLQNGVLLTTHEVLDGYRLSADPANGTPNFLFTENETDAEKLFGAKNNSPYVKNAFHEAIVHGDTSKVNPAQSGTKAAFHYVIDLAAHQETTMRLRLSSTTTATAMSTTTSTEASKSFGASFDAMFSQRIAEADAYYANCIEPTLDDERKKIARAAYAGLIWSKQFYNLVQSRWTSGDPAQVPPIPAHALINRDWQHLYARDVLSTPDKWEFPYFCSWDSSFHCVSLCKIDAALAKRQLLVFLREWYMHRNGQLPAYEFAFSDVNPPVHAWAVWRVYRLPLDDENADREFLERCFQKLLLNFTWWVNREDTNGNNLFSGGFLGLDNIGVFDRSKPLPNGGSLVQADGTAWMAFFCVQMLSIALELAIEDKIYEDLASKFLEHFGAITFAINDADGRGLWDEQDGFYYDELLKDGVSDSLRVRSIVGFIPMLATTLIRTQSLQKFEGFVRRAKWDEKYRPRSSGHILELSENRDSFLLSVVSREQLQRMLAYLFDENEFLSPFGIRSLSKVYESHPYVYREGYEAYRVTYEPGEGNTGMFGGNSNWRGPIWFPINYLILETLRIYHTFYGDSFKVEFPTRSGNKITLGEAAHEISKRLQKLFLSDSQGRRPCHGDESRYATDAAWRDLLLFNEYYHAETGRGCGASHQTGWTALIADVLNLEPYWSAKQKART